MKVCVLCKVALIPPPPLPPPQQPQTLHPSPMKFEDIDNLDQAACRQAMIDYTAENCCYDSIAVKEMTITRHNGLTAYHYTLETFTESRQTECKREPHRGGRVDGPENGPSPSPWDVLCNAEKIFHNQEKKIKIPHTEYVRPCNDCMGLGYIQCSECRGSGTKDCSCRKWSHNRECDRLLGSNERNTCHSCQGGILKCDKCSSKGKATCTKCAGSGNMKTFTELTVKFTNHVSDYVFERSDMPNHLVKEVTGKVVFEQDLDQVFPLTSYPIPEINNNSIRIVNEHKRAFPNERIIRQRQRLLAVPVTEVHFTWKDTRSRYWIYGMERKVYAPDFPHQCCCGCTVL
ncbi:protein SSUH2 homolog [Saccostrea echinata]|uniref:protein SSUH2 homolog n=1 Tax=Saccostrea echinata TaxID=191078 RepID=UPI002A8098AA|nr:protein SSUH2 homolog [Saccostrea echinata]